VLLHDASQPVVASPHVPLKHAWSLMLCPSLHVHT